MKLSLENQQWGEVVMQQSSVLDYHPTVFTKNKQWWEVVRKDSSEPDYHETVFRK